MANLTSEMVQESFNSLSATIILVVDECLDVISNDESFAKLGCSIFDVLLQLLATPQSSVTLLRTLGAAAHSLDKFGVRIFSRATLVGDQLQHWARLMLTMMNNKELSVRSMAVDFVVSLLSQLHEEDGNIESWSLCMLTILPEVVAREIALCHASGLVCSMLDVERTLWPLRRSLADVEEADPLDDDRVNEQMVPLLGLLCRTSQAIIDGVVIEIRLSCAGEVDRLSDIIRSFSSRKDADGLVIPAKYSQDCVFDADEESLMEAACYFSHETSLPQRMRWLFSLRDLHIAKGQWLEAAETLNLCAQSMLKAIDYITHTWRPSKTFDAWHDSRKFPWLLAVGLDKGCCAEVNAFANAFLEPQGLFRRDDNKFNLGHLSIEDVAKTLVGVVSQMVAAFEEERGVEELVCLHLEGLLALMPSKTRQDGSRGRGMRSSPPLALRQVKACIYSKLAKLTDPSHAGSPLPNDLPETGANAQIYVLVFLHGYKPKRFLESTGVPTFLEFNQPSICRVSTASLEEAARLKRADPSLSWDHSICSTFAQPLLNMLRQENDTDHPILLRTSQQVEVPDEVTKTYLSVMTVQKYPGTKARRFMIRSDDSTTQLTVANPFPHTLSRQRALVTKNSHKIIPT